VSSDLARFTSLVSFNASYCALEGELRDDSFTGLTVLQSFAVAGNKKITEEIPSRLGYVEFLGILDLSDNDFTGTVPDLGSLEYLSYLDISKNPQLSGDLDPYICNKDLPVTSAIADCSQGAGVECTCCTMCL